MLCRSGALAEAYEFGLLGLARNLTTALGWYHKATAISGLTARN
jgi:TPR repeat protein